ncbi:MAG: TraB/GumN family protein [Chitinophagaceae bacterium]
MKQPVLIFSILLLFTGNASTQLLYKCESARKDTVTWVLGTMHVMERKYFAHDPMLDSLVAASKVVFVEPLFNDSSNRNFRHDLSRAAKAVYFENDKKLSDFVPPAELKLIESFYTKQLNISRKKLRSHYRFIPYFMLYHLSYNPDQKLVKLDDLVIQKAKHYRKKIVALDHADSIVNAFHKLRDIYSPAWLTQNYEHTQNINSQIKQAYLQQDTCYLKKHIGTPEDLDYDALIRERNNSWKKLIANKSSTHNFLAAGMDHVLAPGDGLLDYYQQQGYTITPVNLKITKLQAAGR